MSAEAPPADGPPAEGETVGEEVPTLSEPEILERMGYLTLDEDIAGMKGVFINTENYKKYNMVVEQAKTEGVHFSGKITFPYVLINRQEQLDDIKKVGFYSDFHPIQKEVEKYPLPEMLFIRDNKKVFGDNFVWANTKASFAEMMEKIDELKAQVIAEYEASLAAGGGTEGGDEGGDGAEGGAKKDEFIFTEDTTVFVQDLPISPRAYESATKEASMTEVEVLTIQNTRPLMQVQIARPRSWFGEAKKNNDHPDHSYQHKPQKDPNFNLLRRELEIGIQAIPSTKDGISQTTWFRPKNATSQYNAADFAREFSFEDSLTDFLTAVSVPVEEALQQNETVDIFQAEFANMGEEELGFGSKSSSNIKEIRNFHDVTFTKGKRIETLQWVPGSTQLLAVSCYDAAPKVESQVKAGISHVLLWSFMDSLAPHAALLSPYDVGVLRFYPTNRLYLVGGLSSGQLIIWKMQPADLGQTKNVHKREEEEDVRNRIPSITHKMLSVIDDSHKKAVMAICWLPAKLLVEGKKGKTTDKQPEEGPIRYFASIAGDGQFLIWDFEAAIAALDENEADFQWKPVHRIQLQRQDSGTEMGCCHLLYCNRSVGDKEIGNFWASSEEGELVYGDWTARGEEDRKPEYCKKMFTISKTFRPMLSLERSPFFPNMILGVTDWGFYIWKEGLAVNLFQSPAPTSYFTCGVWSVTRPSVLFLGRMDGGLDIWDFSDQSHKPSLFHSVTSAAIASMSFQVERTSGIDSAAADSQLAVGDVDGHLHVLTLPKNLVRAGQKERGLMARFFEREEAAVTYFAERKTKLAELKEEMDKNADAVAAGGGAAAQETDEQKDDEKGEEYQKLLDEREAAYKKFELEWRALLAEEEEQRKRKLNA